MCNCCVIEKAKVQRSQGRILGAALWIGAEVIRELLDGTNTTHLSLSVGEGELTLKETNSGATRAVKVQKVGEKVLGVAVWVSRQHLEELGCPLDDELDFEVRVEEGEAHITPFKGESNSS